MTKQETESNLNKLAQLLTSKGVKIEYNSEGENAYFPILNTIAINTRQNVYSKYYSLLHEVGHYLMRQRADFSTKYLMDHTFGSKNKSSRIDVLREEITAWDTALQFAEDNEFQIDKKKWDHYSKKFIFQYALWTVNPQRFVDDD